GFKFHPIFTTILVSFTASRPPRPTLFPYTTLFRSERRRGSAGDGLLVRAQPARDARRERRALRALLDRLDGDPARAGAGGPRPRDRKSTRLNSSHVAISYAVFCLKKKKS